MDGDARWVIDRARAPIVQVTKAKLGNRCIRTCTGGPLPASVELRDGQIYRWFAESSPRAIGLGWVNPRPLGSRCTGDIGAAAGGGLPPAGSGDARARGATRSVA